MFKNLSIKGKMLLGFGCVIVMAVSIAIVALISMMHASETSSDIRRAIAEEVRPMFTVQRAYNNVHAWMHRLEVEPGSAMIQQGLADTDELIRVIGQIPAKRFPGQFADTSKALNEFVGAIDRSNFKQLLLAGQYNEAHKVFLKDILPSLMESNATITTMIYSYLDFVDGEVIHLDLDSNIYITLAITVTCTILALIIALALHKYFVSNITELLTYARELRNGNFRIQINESQLHRDEFGSIQRAFSDIADTLNRTVARTIAISVELEKNSKTLNQSAMAVITGAKDIEQRAISIAAAADEMVSTTSDIAQNCHGAQETSETARVETNSGVDNVRATVMRIKEQAEYTKDDADKVLRLVEQASKISSIVNTIEDIASQTNLLALNAAIEAARAGEAGRGFAVVADEVRALASRTSQSTKEISAMVAGVQADSEDATKSITASVEQMQSVAEQASGLEVSLNEILSAVNAVNTQIVQIATAAEEQINATSEISNNMQSISDVAQQSTDVAGNSGHIAEYCDQLINGLLKELDFFKLDESRLNAADLEFKRIDK